ncbi:hypothetical protein [Flavobacterium reichenbachii]|nr:hypothetical protein [Flavobacterium reichenbachii]
MGKMKDWLLDMQENATEYALAKILGISYEELNELDYQIETDESKDGIIYNYRFELTGNSPTQIIQKINRLQDGKRVYLEPWELDDEFDYDFQFEAITNDKNFLKKFHEEIDNLMSLLAIKIEEPNQKKILNRQVFIGIIGTMESFLSDVFINLVFDNDNYFKNFIKTHPEFKQRKFELREIFEETDRLEETAKKIMLDTIYHNLPVVKEMYEDTFKIKFPSIKEVFKYVFQRHDLVHRNGKTKNGIIVETNEEAIQDLTMKVNEMITNLAKELKLNN